MRCMPCKNIPVSYTHLDVYKRQTQYQKQWLLERAAKHGFALREEGFTVTRVQWQHFAKHGTRPVTLLAVTYEGVLQVTDAEQFRACLLYTSP